MKLRIAATFATALFAACALSGCFAQDAVDAANDVANAASDAVETASGIANAASDAAQNASSAVDALANIQWDKTSRLVVRDAATGEELANVTDQAAIEGAIAGLSEENALASKPDAPQEYLFEIWQPRTVTVLGSSESSADAGSSDEINVLAVTTYEGSDVVTMNVVPIDLELSFSSASTADALRALVR